MAYIHYSSVIPVSKDKVFNYLKDRSHLSEITPDGISFDLTGPNLRMQKGAEYEFCLKRYGMSYIWVVKIEDYQEGQLFTERQIIGLFDSWIHTYRFEDHGENSTLLTNLIQYSVPFGLVGKLMDDLVVKRDLLKVLTIGHEKLKRKLTETPRRTQIEVQDLV